MWRVEWVQSALDDLAELWMAAAAPLRQALTTASRAVDLELQVDPFRQSEGREDDERVLFVEPLGVRIEVDETNRIVWVLEVWRFRRRGE